MNALLFSAFEKTQYENYIPPSNTSLLTDGWFRFPDVQKSPTPKWKKQPLLANELRLELDKLKSNTLASEDPAKSDFKDK